MGLVGGLSKKGGKTGAEINAHTDLEIDVPWRAVFGINMDVR
jgi:hypothetical protein